MSGRTRSTRTLLSLYATGLAVLAALMIGIILVQGTGRLDSAEARFSLGTNLIAAAVYTLVFTALATWVLERNQREGLEEAVGDNIERTLRQIASLNEKYLPEAEYPPTDTFGEAFNNALMASIDGSKTYDFVGPSSRFVAARLRRIRRAPEEVRVAMIDPAGAASIVRRAADRAKWASSSTKSLDQLEAELRLELRASIVALFDYRTTSPVRIVYTNDTIVYRAELTDDSVYFSWYAGPTSATKEMPEAARFGNSSLLYRVIRQEMTRRFEIYPKKVTFDSGHTEADLLGHLGDLLGEVVDADDLAAYRKMNRESTKPLTDFLVGIGY